MLTRKLAQGMSSLRQRLALYRTTLYTNGQAITHIEREGVIEASVLLLGVGNIELGTPGLVTLEVALRTFRLGTAGEDPVGLMTLVRFEERKGFTIVLGPTKLVKETVLLTNLVETVGMLVVKVEVFTGLGRDIVVTGTKLNEELVALGLIIPVEPGIVELIICGNPKPDVTIFEKVMVDVGSIVGLGVDTGIGRTVIVSMLAGGIVLCITVVVLVVVPLEMVVLYCVVVR